MARVKFTAAVDQIVGKWSGSVFSKNRSGAYVRSKSRFKAGTELASKVNFPAGSAGANVRARFAIISRAFALLTQSDVQAWNSAVENWLTTNVFGDSVRPSGFNLFMRLNLNAMNALDTDIVQVLYPPVPEEVPYTSSMEIFFINGIAPSPPGAPNEFNIQFSATIDLLVLTGYAVVIEATPPKSNGRSYVGRSDYRVIDRLIGNTTVPAGLYDVSAGYNTAFGYTATGSLPVGQNVWFRVKWVNTTTGQSGVVNTFAGSIEQA